MSSRRKFQKEEEDYKENIETFWNVFLLRKRVLLSHLVKRN